MSLKMNDFGKKIKKIRKDKGLTQQQFADSLGYAHKSTINKIESGIENMSYQKILVLIKKYMLTAEDLFGDDNNKIALKENINKIFVSFSGRAGGISDFVANNFKKEDDQIYFYRNLNIHSCSLCQYECFYNKCSYENDDSFLFFEVLNKSKEVVFIIPMYCSNAPSLFYKFSERSQAYFNKNEENYKNIKSKTKIILIFGSNDEYPSFSKNFYDFVENQSKIFMLERHKLNIKQEAEKITDMALLNKISKFLD